MARPVPTGNDALISVRASQWLLDEIDKGAADTERLRADYIRLALAMVVKDKNLRLLKKRASK